MSMLLRDPLVRRWTFPNESVWSLVVLFAIRMHRNMVSSTDTANTPGTLAHGATSEA